MGPAMAPFQWLVPLVAIATWWESCWFTRIVTFFANYLALTNVMRKLEPVIAPLQDVQGPLGSTATRHWTKGGWQMIMVRTCGVCIAITTAHLSLPKAEPYLILWGVFAPAAATLVATGLSKLEPKGRWQSLSRKAADIIGTISPSVPNVT